MPNNRIPNHRIDSLVADLEPFTNYNETIVALRQSPTAIDSRDRYTVIHWNTKIADIAIETGDILYLADWYISQTTSTLVGRILRSLPRESVERYLASMPDTADRKRLARMARIA